jgi:hypothetical protein
MASTFWVCGAASLFLVVSWWKLREMKARKVELEARIDDLLTISDSLNRTEGRRRARLRCAMRPSAKSFAAYRAWMPSLKGTEVGGSLARRWLGAPLPQE